MQIYQRTERHTQLVIIIIDRPTKERLNIFKYVEGKIHILIHVHRYPFWLVGSEVAV